MLSYDMLSTMIFSKMHGGFEDLSPILSFIGQRNPIYACIIVAVIIAILVFLLRFSLSIVKEEERWERRFVVLCDFVAIQILVFEMLAVPHNTMLLLGLCGAVPTGTYFIQEIASALIAGVIVVMVDWKRLLRRAKK